MDKYAILVIIEKRRKSRVLKKYLASVVLILSFLLQPVAKADELMEITKAAGYEVKESNRPKSSIIIDANTGAVLWEDNADEIRDPASMSKLMTLYLVYEAIHQGKLSESTVITATENDQSIAKIYAISNNKIVAGVDYTVDELITMTAVPSSNATTVMLANYISGNDPDKFLDMMNEKAKEIGMTNTSWYNASGAAAVSFAGYYLPTRYDIYKANQTTARDMSILSYYFVKNYPEVLEHTKHPVVTVKKGTPYEETFETYNYSLEGAMYGVKGVDGLKTGSSPEGAFNYIATGKRANQRLIEVIMGVGDWSDQNGEYDRHPFGNALIEKAFSDFTYKKVLDKGDHNIDGKTYRLDNDFYATEKKGHKTTVHVENGLLVADSGLKSVNEKINNDQPVKEISKGLFGDKVIESTSKQVKKEGNKLSLTQMLLLLAFIFGGLSVVILLELMRRKKRHSEK